MRTSLDLTFSRREAALCRDHRSGRGRPLPRFCSCRTRLPRIRAHPPAGGGPCTASPAVLCRFAAQPGSQAAAPAPSRCRSRGRCVVGGSAARAPRPQGPGGARARRLPRDPPTREPPLPGPPRRSRPRIRSPALARHIDDWSSEDRATGRRIDELGRVRWVDPLVLPRESHGACRR